MKIIGNTEGNQLLLTAKKEEIYNLVGFNSQYDDGAPKEFRIGCEIDVHKMFSQLNELANSKQDMEKIAKDLRKVAAKFDKEFDPIITPELVKYKAS